MSPMTVHSSLGKIFLDVTLAIYNFARLILIGYLQSPKFLVASICDLPDVINCQFREFAAALLGPVHVL